jgi:ribosome-associated protein
MPLEISPTLSIPDSALSLTFVRAGGPGGQNVNKVSSAVQLRFDLTATAIDESTKQRLRSLAGRRLTEDDAILIIARNHRSQEQNRREAYERLADLIRRALVVPRARRATRPTAASRERRLQTKQRRQRTKRLRKGTSWDE